jgi:hypothetical protein
MYPGILNSGGSYLFLRKKNRSGLGKHIISIDS